MLLGGEGAHVQPDLGDEVLDSLLAQARDGPEIFEDVVVNGEHLPDPGVQVFYGLFGRGDVPPDHPQQIGVVSVNQALAGFVKILLAGLQPFVVHRIDIGHRDGLPFAQFVYQFSGDYPVRTAHHAG